MACCALAAWLIGLVLNRFRALAGRPTPALAWPPPASWDRSSPSGTARHPPDLAPAPVRPGRTVLGLLAVLGIGVEIAAALLLEAWLEAAWLEAGRLDAAGPAAAAQAPPPDHHAHDPGPAAASPVDALIALVALGVGGVLAARRAWPAAGAVVAAAAACSPLLLAAAAGSHLLGMVRLELLAVAVPALAVLAARARLAAGTVPSAVGAGCVALAVGGLPASVYLAHLPGVPARLTASPGWALIGSVAVLAAGLAFWLVVLGAWGYTRPLRLAVLLVVSEAVALLGLALLLAPRPLHGDPAGAPAGVLGLSALADQRLGGALMMAVDLAVLVPLAARLLTRRPADVGAA